MMVHCVPMSGLIESRKLYSTLRVSLLEKEGGEAAEALYDYAACYEQDIAKAMDEFRTERFPTNDLMRYFSLPHKQLETAIRSKVLSAHPTVHAEGKVLYAVLELTMTGDLTVEELRAFTEQIACQYNVGWGGQLEYCDIKARNADVISVRLYHDDITFFTGTAFAENSDGESISLTLMPAGYSGKNTDRPEFQKLLGEIRKGKVRRVIVYKLDRISRSILDFANMMELFQEYDVEFVSSTEKFDTSTPMGRAMLNICIVFAQLERETIQKRVTDAYYSRCLKGFHMSGQAPYGYQLEPTVVEGIRTKKMVADPETAQYVKLMFEMYSEPETSFGDITRYFEEQNIKVYGKSLFRTFLSQLLRNPVYAQADLELYEFFKSQGAAIVNDASDFAGTNGCYLYQGRDVKEDKDRCLKDQILVIAPHEALIPSDVWLKCRKKLMANKTFQQGRKPKNTWLAGKVKCGHCGYALKATHNPKSVEYFRCTKRIQTKGCPGCGKIRKPEFEEFIFNAMRARFKNFQVRHDKEEKANPKLTAYQIELAQVEAEIEKLLDTLTGANATLLAYANKKIEELDTRRQTISKAIAELSVETMSPQKEQELSYYLDHWDSIEFDDKRKAADGLIISISATSDHVQVEWKI